MKNFVLFFPLILLFSSYKPLVCDCENQKLSLAEAVKKSDLICIAKAIEPYNDTSMIFSVIKSWRNPNESTDMLLLIDENCPYYFQEGETYLIYGYEESYKKYRTNICTRTCLASDNAAAVDVKYLDLLIPCLDSTANSIPCTKDLDPVCGCNGVYYGNPCAAEKAGINVWTKGKCKN